MHRRRTASGAGRSRRPAALTAALLGAAAATTAALAPSAQAQTAGDAAAPEAVAAASPSPSAARPSAGAFQIALPLVLDGAQLGQVLVRATATALVSVSKPSLLSGLGEGLAEETRAQIEALEDQFLTPEQLTEFGVDVELDFSTLALIVELELDARGSTEISLSGDGGRFDDLNGRRQSNFAIGVTTPLFLQTVIDDKGDTDGTVIGGAIDGFVSYGGREGLNLDFSGSGAIGFTGSGDDGGTVTEVTRNRITLFTDHIDWQTRYSAGDVVARLPGLLGNVDFLGGSIERRFELAEPGTTLRASGSRSFLLERRARVEVVVNGVIVDEFVAGPGEVDLTDIQFTETSNNVQIFANDTLGRYEVANFSFSSSNELLAPGVFNFSLAGGSKTDTFDGDFVLESDLGAAGSVEVGVFPQLTTKAFGEYTMDFQAFGGGAVVGLPVGLFSLDGVATNFDGDMGYGALGAYTTEFNGLFGFRDRFTLSSEYRSDNFVESSDSGAETNEELRSNAIFEMGVTETTNINLGSSYRFIAAPTGSEDDEEIEITLGVSQSFGALSASFLGSQIFDENDEDEFRFFAGLSYRLGPQTTARARYDSRTTTGTAEIERSSVDVVGDFGYRLRLEGDDDDLDVLGGVDYVANRFEASVEANRQDSLTLGDGDTEIFARFQTGFAFADGQLAVGRDPARGFAIVRKHDSLEDATVNVLSGVDQIAARDGLLGPAVGPVGGAHRQSLLTIGVDDLPPGYDIGATEFVLLPGARPGFLIDVGSDANRSVIGVLLLDGEPFALKTGVVRQVSGADGGAVEDAAAEEPFFTNRTGRFALIGLTPGVYRLSASGGRYTADVVIEADAEALVRLGDIELTEN